MRSEIKFSGPSLRVTLTIGFFLTFITIFLAVWFRFEFGIVLLVLAASIGGTGLVAGYNRLKEGKQQRLLRDLEANTRIEKLRQEKYKANRMELEQYVISFNRNERLIMLPKSEVRVIEPIASTQVQPALLPAPDEAGLPRLMDLIADEPSLIFLGPKQTGKTNSLLHWLAVRGQAVVVDPKNEGTRVNEWPENVQVAANRKEIERAVAAVLNEMHKRRIGGIRDAPPLTLFFDEIHDLISRLKVQPIDIALKIATLGAQFNVFSGFTTHANTTKYLKIDAVALLANFDIVRVSKIGGVHKCYLDQGEGEFECIPPPEYIAPAGGVIVPLPAVPSQGQRIEELIEAGASDYKICKEVWRKADGKKGARNDNRYDQIRVIRKNMAL